MSTAPMTQSQGRTIVILLIAVLLLELSGRVAQGHEIQPWLVAAAVLLVVGRGIHVLMTMQLGRGP